MNDDDDLHHDPLAPARGLVYGVLFGMVLWLLILAAWAVIFR